LFLVSAQIESIFRATVTFHLAKFTALTICALFTTIGPLLPDESGHAADAPLFPRMERLKFVFFLFAKVVSFDAERWLRLPKLIFMERGLDLPAVGWCVLVDSTRHFAERLLVE